MNKDRLLLLADFLEKLPPERVDYHRWVGAGWKGHQDLSCGTSACALGWAATMPEFQALGLRIRSKKGFNAYVGLEGVEAPSFAAPYKAAKKIFDLKEGDAEYLFAPEDDDYAYSPVQVARKIRWFVDSGGHHASDADLGIYYEE